MNLAELTEKYGILEKKYKLPSFFALNEDFEIEKIRKGQETLLRTVRKTMMEKLVNSLGFVESLLNPINAPRMYLPYLKGMTAEDKKELDRLYSVISDIVIASLRLEIDYSEKDEAEMIIRIAKDWNSIKPSFRKVIDSMQKPVSNVTKEKSYFG